MRCLSRISNIGVELPSAAVIEREGTVRLVKLTCRLALMVLLLTSGTLSTFSQDAAPSPTPSDEELRLREEKRLLELKRDIEQAKKAIRDAQPESPTPSVTPLAGDTTLDQNVKIEAEMVSYKAMSEAVFIVSEELKGKIAAELERPINKLDAAIKKETDEKIKGKLSAEKRRLEVPNLAIYDSQVVKDWRFYQALFPAFDGQVKDIVNRYANLLCPMVDVSPEFKAIFCEPDNSPRPFAESSEVTAQLLPAAIPTAFAAGTNLLKTFIDLVALFRTDTKIDGKAVTIEESALVAEIFRMLKTKYEADGEEINLYYPEVFHPRVMSATNGNTYSSTITTIGTLFLAKTEADKIIAARNETKKRLLESIKDKSDKRDKLVEELDKVQVLLAELRNLSIALTAEDDPVVKKRIRAEIAEVKVKLDKMEPPTVLQTNIDALDEEMLPTQEGVKAINDVVKRLTALNERFQSFVDEFVKVDANAVNALALLIKSEDIEHALPEGNSYWLEIKSVTAGGNNRTRKNLLRYFAGAKLDHSGGVVLEYTLYRRTGSVIYSDKLSYYEGYVEPKKIKDRTKFRDPED